MGATASITIHSSHITDKHFKELLASKEMRNELFATVCSHVVDDHITLKDKISFKKLVHFFTDKSHPLYEGMVVNVPMLTEAFKYATKGKKHEQLNKRDFHIFLPALFLFSKLYDMYDQVDRAVINDNKVFRGEFLRAKNLVASVEGVVMVDVTDEDWEREFDKLDVHKMDGFISFSEFCHYCIKHIVKPADFVEDFEKYDSDEEDVVVTAMAMIEQEDAVSASEGAAAAEHHHGPVAEVAAAGTVAEDTSAHTST